MKSLHNICARNICYTPPCTVNLPNVIKMSLVEGGGPIYQRHFRFYDTAATVQYILVACTYMSASVHVIHLYKGRAKAIYFFFYTVKCGAWIELFPPAAKNLTYTVRYTEQSARVSSRTSQTWGVGGVASFLTFPPFLYFNQSKNKNKRVERSDNTKLLKQTII